MSTLLLMFTLLGCKGEKDENTDDSTATDDSAAPETGSVTGIVMYPGQLSAESVLHIGARSGDLQIWQDPAKRQGHENPQLPYTYTMELPAGSYYLAAFLDTTGDSPGGPNEGDPSGVALNDTGAAEITVTVGEISDVPVINLKTQDQGGEG